MGTALTAAAGKPRSSMTAAIGIDTFIVSGRPHASAAASRKQRASVTWMPLTPRASASSRIRSARGSSGGWTGCPKPGSRSPAARMRCAVCAATAPGASPPCTSALARSSSRAHSSDVPRRTGPQPRMPAATAPWSEPGSAASVIRAATFVGIIPCSAIATSSRSRKYRWSSVGSAPVSSRWKYSVKLSRPIRSPVRSRPRTSTRSEWAWLIWLTGAPALPICMTGRRYRTTRRGGPMPVQPPTRQQLEWLADMFHLTLTEEELDVFEVAAGPTIGAMRRLAQLPAEHLPVKYPRADLGHRPVGEENPSNGWSWVCSIPGAASGPLAGRTVGVKDNVCVAGIPLLNGSPIMEGYVPREDATVVTRLLDAGAHIVGKTAVPAFCFDGGGLTGYPEPQPTNPHDPALLAGASSNGSAAVVVTGQADMALGGDQGGSIRLPSSWSGCCGHKPTHGLVPYTGIFPIELTLDHIGPMAMTVADCALMLETIAGPDGLDPRQVDVATQPYSQSLEAGADGLRVGVLSEGFEIPDVSEPEVDAAVRGAADALAGAGADVEEVSVPMHRDGLAIWNAIAIEGATDLMVRGDAFGTNHKGHYTTDL